MRAEPAHAEPSSASAARVRADAAALAAMGWCAQAQRAWQAAAGRGVARQLASRSCAQRGSPGNAAPLCAIASASSSARRHGG